MRWREGGKETLLGGGGAGAWSREWLQGWASEGLKLEDLEDDEGWGRGGGPGSTHRPPALRAPAEDPAAARPSSSGQGVGQRCGGQQVRGARKAQGEGRGARGGGGRGAGAWDAAARGFGFMRKNRFGGESLGIFLF